MIFSLGVVLGLVLGTSFPPVHISGGKPRLHRLRGSPAAGETFVYCHVRMYAPGMPFFLFFCYSPGLTTNVIGSSRRVRCLATLATFASLLVGQVAIRHGKR